MAHSFAGDGIAEGASAPPALDEPEDTISSVGISSITTSLSKAVKEKLKGQRVVVESVDGDVSVSTRRWCEPPSAPVKSKFTRTHAAD